ncbi:MAG: hypothetical protein ABWX69_05265 [Arthrobacter sp.]
MLDADAAAAAKATAAQLVAASLGTPPAPADPQTTHGGTRVRS